MSRKKVYGLLFLITQLSLIFCHIYASSLFTQYSYSKQKNERAYQQLIEQKNELTRMLAELKSPSSVKAIAARDGMVPIRLKMVKRLSHLDTHASDITP